jgi:nucleoporin GLE1
MINILLKLWFQRSLGYKIIDGKIEEDVHYFKRMSGVMHLYFTFLMQCTSENKSVETKSFDGLKVAWQWISDILNMTPRPNITAEVLSIFFKCCGFQMHKSYGKQFVKLVQICSSDYLKLIELIPSDLQSGASVGRLKNVFDSFKKNRQFAQWKKWAKTKMKKCPVMS